MVYRIIGWTRYKYRDCTKIDTIEEYKLLLLLTS